MSTDVAFHFNIDEPVGYASRLVRKARSRGLTVLVTGQEEPVRRLDAAMWLTPPLSFSVHCNGQAPQYVRERSPVLLCVQPDGEMGADVLINMGLDWLPNVAQFRKVIELVGLDSAARDAARQRWRMYGQQGLKPTAIDSGASG